MVQESVKKKKKGRKSIESSSIRYERVKTFMEREGLTQNAFAEKVGLSQQRVSNILKTKKISDYTIHLILEAFPDYREPWFFGYDSFPTKQDEKAAKMQARSKYIKSLSDVPNSLNMLLSAVAKSKGYEMREIANDIGAELDSHVYEIIDKNDRSLYIRDDDLAKHIIHYVELEMAAFLTKAEMEGIENG
jgi:transcriptional regulator with XRE-family HTH domain